MDAIYGTLGEMKNLAALGANPRMWYLVHPGEAGSNYAKGRFDRRELPIVSVILSLSYTLDYTVFVARMGLYL